MATRDKLVITVPLLAAWRTTVGIALAAATIVAFGVYFQLPQTWAYRGVVIGTGVIAGAAALDYWLWCCMQRARTEHGTLARASAASQADVVARQTSILDALDIIRVQLESLSDTVEADRGDLKQLSDVVESVGSAIEVATGAVEALQDAYMKQGPPPK